MLNLSDSELSDSDVELQEALADGRLKPGLNIPQPAPKQFVNNVGGLKQKLSEFKLDLPWIETLDSISKQAALAPELAAQMLIYKEKRENQMKNNKKLPQFDSGEDPVLNDFKRETMFHRQAQSTVLEALPRLKVMGLSIIRPDDYFAEMAKSDEHMQKIRSRLMQTQVQKQKSERAKQLRTQRKEGKMLQIQARLERQKEKKTMLDQVKKIRKGQSKDLGFLDGKNNKSKRATEKRNLKEKKFGYGGKKKGTKLNTKDSAADVSDYRRPQKPTNKKGKMNNKTNNRPGKNRRIKNKTRSRR